MGQWRVWNSGPVGWASKVGCTDGWEIRAISVLVLTVTH